MSQDQARKSTVEQLIDFRSASNTACSRAAESLRGLLHMLDGPSRLPGLKKIARNALEILDPTVGVPVGEHSSYDITAWRTELEWIVEQAVPISNRIFDSSRDKEKFLREKDNNPVLYQDSGATMHPLYCQLWETHENPEYDRKFRLLQGHFMFAYFAVAKKATSASWQQNPEKVRVASQHIYQSSLPLKHFAKFAIDDKDGNKCKALLLSLKPNIARKDFAQALWDFRNKETKKGSVVAKDLASIAKLLDWSLSGSYIPEPRTTENQNGEAKKVAGSREPEARVDTRDLTQSTGQSEADARKIASTAKDTPTPSEPKFVPALTFDVREDSNDGDVWEEVDLDVDAQGNTLVNRNTDITCYARTERDPEKIAQILRTGDNPGRYLEKSSLHLAKSDRGIRLHMGGWVEMRNQFLPWQLNELTDEEMADAWLRLEEHARSRDPESVEIFALANTLIWSGRIPKHLLHLEIIRGKDNPSGDIGFFLPANTSTQSAAELRIRPLAIPHREPITVPVQNEGARVSMPFFSLPDYAGIERILRLHVSLQPRANSGGGNETIFKRSLREYESLLRDRLAAQPGNRPPNELKRVTLARFGYALFQRIVDLTAGDLVAASLITGRDEAIARDDRYYAAPSIKSLREIYRRAIGDLRQELVALGCPLKEQAVSESETDGASVGSTICPTVDSVKKALAPIQERFTGDAEGEHCEQRNKVWSAQHNFYSLYSALVIGWTVGFRAIKDPFIHPDDIDFISGITAFQDKGPEDQSKSRLMRLPGLALSQMRAFFEYLMDPSFSRHLYDLVECPFFLESTARGVEICGIRPTLMDTFLADFLPLPVNASRHFGRTEWIERGVAPEHVAAWLGHFFQGEEPWGKYSTYRYAEFCRFMETELTQTLKHLGFEARDNDGKRIADIKPEVERFRRRKAQHEPSGED